MTDFPLISKWLPGLMVVRRLVRHPDGYASFCNILLANHLEEELAKGVQLFGLLDQWVKKSNVASHEALLIGIREIKPVTAEDFLRAIVNARDKARHLGGDPLFNEIYKASAYLQRKGDK
jgi:hypothetical protein